MEEAIRRAIEGGYINNHREWHEALGHTSIICKWAVASDILFWRHLGKALGWGSQGHNWSTDGQKCDYCEAWDDDTVPAGAYDDCWKYHWHRFIDWLADGKSHDDFFNELLK